ncbi:ATP phosphoribosyltransferase regulatory subunit, partial [Beggiatoa alba]|nr:ATP phosphoribosyltransferase regulatory subunit [Beggiatoa alba]
ELLPPQAERLEQLRRELLDLFKSWGYELVIPSLVEYLDSLLTGMGNDLELQTFKLTDQLNGRLMGVRADITPQVARIDAHRLLDREGPVRLCYQGTVLHTRGDGLGGSRSFTQIGAELYGHSGVESDAEMVCLMLQTLTLADVGPVYVDLGHVGIFRALTQTAGLDSAQESALFDALQRKAVPEIQSLLASLDVDAKTRQAFEDLVWLNGDSDVLARARKSLASNAAALKAVDDIERVAARVSRQQPGVQLHFDLAELRGFHYHTGVVFAAYQPGQGCAIAQGGRYDDIGKVFGRARAATGFSADLRSLIALGTEKKSPDRGVFAPLNDDPALMAKIAELRAASHRVVCELSGQDGGALAAACPQRLVLRNGDWVVVDAPR